MKKYKLLKDDTIKVFDKTLCRIKALKDFSNVKVGDLGGYVESEANLDHSGDCWVFSGARVFGGARVYGEARVCGKARVYDNARVFDRAQVSGETEVFGEAQVFDGARVFGKALVYGEARVCGNAWVFGEARVYGEAKATTLVQNCSIFKHSITMSDTHIAIGCENHTYVHWKKHINEIGKKHRYSDKEIKAIRYILNGLLIMKQENS